MSVAAGAAADYRPGLLCEKHDTVTQIQLTKEKTPALVGVFCFEFGGFAPNGIMA
jgi:hypothetical protein